MIYVNLYRFIWMYRVSERSWSIEMDRKSIEWEIGTGAWLALVATCTHLDIPLTPQDKASLRIKIQFSMFFQIMKCKSIKRRHWNALQTSNHQKTPLPSDSWYSSNRTWETANKCNQFDLDVFHRLIHKMNDIVSMASEGSFRPQYCMLMSRDQIITIYMIPI